MLQWIAAPTCIYGKPLFGLIELFKTGSMRMGVSGREPKTGVSVIKNTSQVHRKVSRNQNSLLKMTMRPQCMT